MPTSSSSSRASAASGLNGSTARVEGGAACRRVGAPARRPPRRSRPGSPQRRRSTPGAASAACPAAVRPAPAGCDRSRARKCRRRHERTRRLGCTRTRSRRLGDGRVGRRRVRQRRHGGDEPEAAARHGLDVAAGHRESSASARRRPETTWLRLFSSTTRPGHSARIRASLSSSSPAFSTNSSNALNSRGVRFSGTAVATTHLAAATAPARSHRRHSVAMRAWRNSDIFQERFRGAANDFQGQCRAL